MEYNTSRNKLFIPEYGRNIQKMIEYTVSIEDREKRSRMAETIISIMGQIHPQLRDIGDFQHKLWDHLFIISNFKLDIDAPYPPPTLETLSNKQQKTEYNKNNIRFRHYGKNIELMIHKAIEYEDGQEKDALTTTIANHLKKLYLTWNRDSVNDEQIEQHLSLLSNGKLKLSKNTKLNLTSDILARTRRKRHSFKSSNGSSPGNGKPRRK